MAKGSFILYGVPGTGKSTAALQTFQDALYIASSPNNAQFYKQWLQCPEGKASGKKLPKREMVLDMFSLTLDGKVYPQRQGVSQLQHLNANIKKVVDDCLDASAAGKPAPYNYVILDELGTFWARVFEEIKPTVLNREGKLDGLGAFNVAAKWSRDICNYMRQLLSVNVGLCVITHDQEPEKEKDRKGGPKLISQGVQRELCADFDGVLLALLEDPEVDINNPGAPKRSKRIWRVHGSQHHLSKLRGMPDEMFDTIHEWPLDRIIPAAGYQIS